MRILFLADLGFASPRITNLALGLSSHGIRCSIFTPSMNRSQEENFGLGSKAGVDIYHLKPMQMLYKRSNLKAIRALFRLLDLILSRLFSTSVPNTLGIRDHHYKWVSFIERRILDEIGKADSLGDPYTHLITSSGPITMHIVGSRLKLSSKLKWVADYQDLFSMNHASTYYGASKFREFETSLLKESDGVISISQDLVRQINEIYKGPTEVIYLGYIPYPDESSRVKENCTKVSIVYTGQIYPEHYDFEMVLNVFEELEERGNENISLSFVGQAAEIIRQHYKSNNKKIPTNVKLRDYVSRSVSLGMQRDSDFLLLFKWSDQNQPGVLPTKFYEYIAARRPILVVGGFKDELSTFVENFNLGYQFEDKDRLLDFLTQPSFPKKFLEAESQESPAILDYRSNAKRLIGLLEKLER